MPYNNTPIAPAKEITGTVALPLARVKKIIQADPDNNSCSNNAAFLITVAAEQFLQHLVAQAHNQAKSEKKPRRNIQYKDVANAVSRVENLEFLGDVVPKVMTYRQYKEKAAKEGGAKGVGAAGGVVEGEGGALGKGQGTLDGHFGGAGVGGVVAEEQAVNGAAVQEGMELDEDDERTMSPPDAGAREELDENDDDDEMDDES